MNLTFVHSSDRSAMRRLGAGAILVSLLLAPAIAAGGNDRTYFPDRGPGAVHQLALDLLNPVAILYVAFQPGAEDLSTLVSLRMGNGAKVAVVYLTSGEATPSDLNGEVPYLLAGRRKDEAVALCRYLDFHPHFLNLPDPGILADSSTLERVWDADTIVARLKPALQKLKPDAVLLGFDPRETREGPPWQKYLRGVLLEAFVQAERGPEAWKVKRFFLEQGGAGSLRSSAGTLHPVWRKSYRAIAEEAGKLYASLRGQRIRWSQLRSAAYRLVHPLNRGVPATFIDGLPEMSKRMRAVEPAIIRAAGGKGMKNPRLSDVSAGIDSLERFVRPGSARLNTGESRLLSTWRNALEALRCALLDVKITYECSDSLLSQRQLFFLRIKEVKARASTAPLEILFPQAMQSDGGGWIINETKKSRFPVELPAEFRILTPEKLEFGYPTAVYGLQRPEVRLPFSFMLFHADSLREHNFAYRAEWSLGIGPRRAFEVRTPLLRALPGEPIVYSFLNFSRDPFNGQIAIVDSMLPAAVRRAVRLTGKDHLLVDTLFLPVNTSLPEGDYVFGLNISGGGGRWPVVARSFDVRIDSGRTVGLVTGIEASPLSEALRRMRVPLADVDSVAASGAIDSLRVVILDREALTLREGAAKLLPELRGWVENGGHLVVFPQFLLPEKTFTFGDSARFDDRAPVPPGSALAVDSTHPFLEGLNRVRSSDWDDWIVARASGTLHIGGAQDAEVPVRVKGTHAPLLLTKRSGKGRITLVALDMISQLANVKPGVHRLLANILAAH